MPVEKVSPLVQKLIYDVTKHTELFPDDGAIALHTLAWLNACLGHCFGIIDFDEMVKYYDVILEQALEKFPKYEWRIRIDEEDCRGPNKVWLAYKFRPECQS